MAIPAVRESAMSSIDSVAHQYRSLCLSGIADQLSQLLSQAEANDSSYPDSHRYLHNLKLKSSTISYEYKKHYQT